MKTERQLARLSNERLDAHLNYHIEAVTLAAIYGRRSVKDEQALERVRKVMKTRNQKPH
ncbi:hypothetical protein GHV40_14165 [Devosia sp. D6-9]|nr:hypothetical protein GHV40_14165 [Devosia sp. D6-9]